MFAKLAAVGFFLIIIVASNPVPGDLVATSSVATPLGSSQLVVTPLGSSQLVATPLGSSQLVVTPIGSSQLVASASDRDEGLLKSVVPDETSPAPPTLESDDAKKDGSLGGGVQPPPASEVGDMMQDPYHNITLSASDRDEEAAINNDTDIVEDSHVNPINKTHEEEASEDSTLAPLDGSTAGSSFAPTTEGSTAETEKKEESDNSETKSVEMDVTEKVAGEVSLAEVTPLPVGALVSDHGSHDHPAVGRSSSLHHTTQVAAILAGVLVLVAVMGYLGLLLWRRVLEGRYGNREMLVNEDDDFKHFEL